MKNYDMQSNGRVWKGLAAGLVGGLVASWVMNEFQQVWQKTEETVTPPEKKKTKSEESTADDPTIKTANEISKTITGHKLNKEESKKAGPIVHYAFGTIMGGVYGIAAEITPAVKSAGGLTFGAALFVGADELALPLLHLAKPPQQYPASKHASGFASHMVWVWTTELVRRAVLTVF